LGLAYLGRTDSAVGGICQQRSGGFNYNSGFSTYINYGNNVSIEWQHWCIGSMAYCCAIVSY
jgi:hypothetical protein